MLNWLGRLIKLPETFLNISGQPGGGVIQVSVKPGGGVIQVNGKYVNIGKSLTWLRCNTGKDTTRWLEGGMQIRNRYSRLIIGSVIYSLFLF